MKAPRLITYSPKRHKVKRMLQAKSNHSSPLALKSAILMLLGSLLLGFVITRSIYEYLKYNSALDEVDVEISVQENVPQLVLDTNRSTFDQEVLSQEMSSPQEIIELQNQGANDWGESYALRIPRHIEIPSIDLDAEIGFASLRDVEIDGKTYQQWVAPADLVGWHYESAVLGEPGNTVLNGHHNVFGEVFKELSLVEKGDQIVIQSDYGDFYYKVASVMILPERFESSEVRLQNARWIQHSEDERLTLISCWPYESNTHRVIVVAFPIDVPDQAETTGGTSISSIQIPR
jgi:LPXTG-site transpeptidase (sortase) family protein